MPNDPILDAIQGGGTAVSDDDPILSAIKGSGSRAPKKATAKASSADPIMAAIQGTSDEPVVPFQTTPNPSGTLTERASKLGKSTIPLGPPKNPKPYDTTQIPINVFSGGAQQPGMRTEEEKRAAGTIEGQPDVTLPGAHGTSVHLTPSGIDSMGKVFLPGANPNPTLQGNAPIIDPSRGLVAPQNILTEGEQKQHPILTGLGQLGEGLTTPENLAILAGTMGFGELPAGARAALSTYFAAQTAKGAVDSYTQGWKAYKRGDNAEAQRLFTLAAGNAIFAGTAGAHAVRETGFGPNVGPESVLPRGTISKPLAMDEATARGDRAARVNAQAQTGLENVDQAVQTPSKTIGAGNERLAPEKPETLNAQVDALAKGTNPVVYFPKGSESIPAPPENSQVTVVAGKKAGAGTYYHSDEITPRQIRDAVKNGTFGELLGHEQTKEEVSQGQPVVVVARDENGIEQKASLVDAGNHEALTRQAQTLQDQFPQAKISTESPQQVIERRTASSVPYRGPERRSLKDIQGPSPMRAGLVKELTDLANDPRVSEKERVDAQARLDDIKAHPFESGENLGEEIRQARAKSSGQPMSLEAAQANEAARKADNSPTPVQSLPAPVSRETPQVNAQAKTKIPRTPPGKLEKFTGDPHGQKIAQLYVNRLRNPVEREFAMSYLKARLAGKSAPARIASLDATRAATLKSRIESELQRTAPQALSKKYSPETLETARQELEQAHDLASNFERPGRYQKVVEGSRYEEGGAWYGVGSSRHIVADQFPWYKEIEQGPDKLGDLIKKGKGAEYERLLDQVAASVEREKESAAPVVAEFASRLRELSDRIDGNDPELSESLAQLSNGDGRGFKNLREYLSGRVTDAERANSFFTAIDDAAAEARQAGTPEATEHAGAIRPGESGRFEESGTEASSSPGTESPRTFSDRQAPQTSQVSAKTTENISKGQSRTLPGMENAVAEQKKAAGEFQGEKLTQEINKPPASIEEAAGKMERESPLFRNTEANPQKDMFAPKAAEVGDRIQPTSGPLKGKTLEVTKIGETGIYAREGDGPIKFVRNGEFKGQEKPSFETRALDELVAPTEGEAPGTRYSGLSPAALKRLLPESVREKLDTEVEANQRARGLQGQLYDLESQNAADLIRSRNVLKEAPGTAEDMEAIYHHLEDPSVRLTSEQQKILDGYLRPILDESARINEKLEGGQVENYVHRISVGKANLLDRILGGESELSAGRGLSKSSGSLKGRTMMALEDEAGNRRVVSIKDGNVTAINDGQAENLGRIRGLETQGVKSRGEVLDRELEPMRRELDKLETERRTLTATKGREASARRRIENIDNREAELREALQDAYRTDEGRLLSEADLRGRVFVDKNGKQWKLGQATTKEIEANTGVRYYKNALASTVLNFISLRKAERAYDFLESYKNSPDFQQAAAKIKGGSVPAGWRTTELPQFHDYAFEPHTAEVLDWYAKRLRTEGPNLYRQIGNFLRTAIFFNPLIHTPNIGVHWIVEKGLTGLGPQNWGRILRTGSRAIDAVIHQNQDFIDALDEGAPMQSARLDNGATTRLLLERMGRELEANSTAAQKVARALGYANPLKLIRSIYDFSGKVTWVSNDVAMLQAAYEHMERTGSNFKDAMADVSKHIPDYRLPTRIFNSTTLAKLMSSPDLTMFGAYHYGALRSYAEMAKGLVAENMPQAERLKSVDRLAMLGLFTFVVYPQLDKLAKLLTGDKTAQFRRAGASTFIWNLVQLANGDKSPTEVLESVATPAVHTKALLQLAVNRDFFTGRHIVDWNADAKTIAKQLARYAGQNIAPVNQGMQMTEGRRTVGQQVASLAGIKTKVPTPAEALARKFAAESAGTSVPDQDTVERAYLRRQYENGLRDGKMTIQELARAVGAGKITGQDTKTILQRAARTPLQNSFKSLPIEKALQVWQKADPHERQSLKPLLIAKAERLNPDRYSPAQLKDLREKFIGALRNSIPTAPAGRAFPALPLTPRRNPGSARPATQ